ncbi:unnamed protein product [Brassica rapa subsp. trilocularis]
MINNNQTLMRAIQKLKQHPKRTESETHSRLPTTKHRHHPNNIIPFLISIPLAS